MKSNPIEYRIKTILLFILFFACNHQHHHHHLHTYIILELFLFIINFFFQESFSETYKPKRNVKISQTTREIWNVCVSVWSFNNDNYKQTLRITDTHIHTQWNNWSNWWKILDYKYDGDEFRICVCV